MHTVLLLRGINVGGAGKLPMADLRDLLRALGCANVATYIQSGNAVFSGTFDVKTLAIRIEDAIEAQFDFRPRALVLTAKEMIAARDNYPFPAALQNPQTGHISFLAGTANTDLEAMRAIAAPDEEFQVGNGVFYLFAPSGIGRSKLAAKAENLLGTAATARNLNTVNKVCDMVMTLK